MFYENVIYFSMGQWEMIVTCRSYRCSEYHLVLQPDELADMFLAIADGTAKEQNLFAWIKSHLI